MGESDCRRWGEGRVDCRGVHAAVRAGLRMTAPPRMLDAWNP